MPGFGKILPSLTNIGGNGQSVSVLMSQTLNPIFERTGLNQ